MNWRMPAVWTMAAAVLGGCISNDGEARAPFDPASCATRDFNVYFEGQSTDLSSETREAIVAMGDMVEGCVVENVRIVGSADAAGSESVNEEVSEQRALLLADFLARRLGWPREQMDLLATGERGATNDAGLDVPMRSRAHVTVITVAP